jgi:group II intron reverse transcriptase/maturase
LVNAAAANDTIDPARRLQRALYRAAKASATRRFHALYDKVYREDILARAWQEVKANAGSAGPDGHTIEQIEQQGVEGFLGELAAELREGRYRPRAVRRVRIPKADGGERPLGIPAVRDRIVQAAAKVVLEPIFEADFRPSSYGFRPRRDAHQAGEQVRQAVNRGASWVVDADIAAFFDRIDHAVLLRLVERRVSDRRMLKLLRQWLGAGVEDGGAWSPSVDGVPQGGVISPLLANVVLHELDRLWEDDCGHLGQLIRYADDFVILCRTEGAAREGLGRVGAVLTDLGLTLHPEKTRVVFVGDGREGFDFLGFHCRKVESWRYRGRRYLQRWPSCRAMQGVRDRIKAITAPRYRLLEPAQALVDELNRLLRGWGAYFRVGNSSRKFLQVDDYVRQRLALFLSKKTGRRGRCWERHSWALFQALGVYQLSGTVQWYKAAPRAVR